MRLGIGQRLNITLVSVFIFFCMVFMAINIFYFLKISKEDFEKKINELSDFSAEINSENIWNFDTKSINKFTRSLFNEESLRGIIYESTNFNQESGNHIFYGFVSGKAINTKSSNIDSIAPNKNTYSHHTERDIIHNGNNIGKAYLYFSDKYIYVNAINHSGVFILGLVIFILLYSVTIYLLIKRQLLTPLKNIHRLALGVSGFTFYLNESVSQERWSNVQQLLSAEKINQKNLVMKKRNDELSDFMETFFSVLTGFELVVSQLSQYSAQLQTMNEELETRIASRTAELEDSHKKVFESLHTLQQTKSQLAQQEKLASIGQLAAGVAHEINNPIGYVGSNINRLADYFDDMKFLLTSMENILTLAPAESASNIQAELAQIKHKIDYEFLMEDVSSVISESQEGVSRIKDIVQSLKDFSHNTDDQNFTDIDINAAIKTTLKVINNELKYTCDVILDLQLARLVTANLGQIHQVISNLIVNASHAIKATNVRGQLTIRTYSDDDFVYINITDTGGGIPEEIHSKIFDPFFTTKPIGQGTGLGLNICYDIIVNKHRGELSFTSKMNIGTVFTIKLPLTISRPE
jgi:two-component system, NtrC family, sensor kinase